MANLEAKFYDKNTYLDTGCLIANFRVGFAFDNKNQKRQDTYSVSGVHYDA